MAEAIEAATTVAAEVMEAAEAVTAEAKVMEAEVDVIKEGAATIGAEEEVAVDTGVRAAAMVVCFQPSYLLFSTY